MYPAPLSPRTADEAYSYVPETATDCYLQVSTSSARSKIPFARHALLELRAFGTGKRRKLSTGQMIIPLCFPTNDHDRLDAYVAAGAEIARRVNKWLENDWASENGCACVVVATDYPRAFVDGKLREEAEQWLNEFCNGMYVTMPYRIGFREEEYAFYFRMKWAGLS